MLNLRIDNKKHTKKPNNKIGSITNRIVKTENLSVEPKVLGQAIKEGKAFMLCHLKENKASNENAININTFTLDIDNCYSIDKEKVYTNHNMSDVITHIQKIIGATPIISYTTYTGVNKENNSHRFRLIYQIENNITSKELNIFTSWLSTVLPKGMMDESCKDASRRYFATNKPDTVKIYDNSVNVSLDILKAIVDECMAEQEQQEKERQLEVQLNKEYRANIDNSIDDILNIDIVDVFNNLAADTRINAKGPNYIQYKTCPICGHKNDFTIYPATNSFNCFGGAGGIGGNVINLYATLKNISYGQAIKELQDLYNIKPSKAIEPSNALTIDKYISGDKKALETILGAIKDNRKVALFSSMGTGKTYFTVNNLYEYAKSINKTLIIVIPNVAQLENMKNKYKVPIVCGNHKYKGSDIVAVTPESLPKVTEQLGQDEYILVCDEAHENITSYAYRNGYKQNNVGLAEGKAYKTIHMTATLRTLIYNNYDSILNVNSKDKITNKINILPIAKATGDSMNQVIKYFIGLCRQVLFFNNDIKKNSIYANALNGFDGSISDDNFMIDETYINVLADTLKSGDINTSIMKSVQNGIIPADKQAILFTSTIKAGIDLKTEHKAPILLINAIDNTNIDDIIQLIGRFRDGIEVFILTKDLKENMEQIRADFNTTYNSLLDIALYNLKYVKENPITYEMFKDGYIKDFCIEKQEENFIINKQALTHKAYKTFCKTLNKDYRLLINELQEQQAFNIDGDINTYNIEINDKDTTIKEVLKASKEEKEAIKEECISTLLNADISQIKSIYEPLKLDINIPNSKVENIQDIKIKTVNGEIIEAYNTLKTVDKKLDTLVQEVTETLNIDNAEGLVKVLKTPKKELKKELEQVQTIKVNRAIKEVGVDTYLKNRKAKTSIEMVQAKIIKELEPIIDKRGRVTNKVIINLAITLIKEGYIINANSKKYLNTELDIKVREKALSKVIEQVKTKVNIMFNFRDNKGLISRIKYE